MNHLQIPQSYIELCPILDSTYRLLFNLGQGRYSKYLILKRVKLAIHTKTKETFAIKISSNKGFSSNSIPNQTGYLINQFIKQCSIMSRLHHKNIVNIKEAKVNGICKKYSGKCKFVHYIVMNIAEHGQLYRILEETSPFNQRLARFFFKKLLKGSSSSPGIQYMHQKGIAHRDIKTENILIDSNMNMKIADFGFSTQFLYKKKKILAESTQMVGSPQYNAPEIINKYQKLYQMDSADIFSLGIVLFEMVMGSSPFNSANAKDPYYKKYLKDRESFWKIFSGLANPSQIFKERMLVEEPKNRIKINQIRNHIWMKGQQMSFKQVRESMQSRIYKLNQKKNNQRAQIIRRKRMKTKNCKIQPNQLLSTQQLDVEMKNKIEKLNIDLRLRIQKKQIENQTKRKQDSAGSKSGTVSSEQKEFEQKFE